MKGKRTDLDFEKHNLLITAEKGLLVHYLKKPETNIDSVKFINTNGIMAVTGDYGNWIFCREFHPTPEGYVSDHYWGEKLKNSSCQEPAEFDSEATIRALQLAINDHILENEEPNLEWIEYLKECIKEADGQEYEYTFFAYDNCPYDSESVILIKEYKYWLRVVFDAFDEICRRLKESPETIKNTALQSQIK